MLYLNHKRDIEILVADVFLEEDTGPDLYARLREGDPSLKVITMSGVPRPEIESGGVVDPGDPFLQKPLSLSALRAAISELIDGQST